MRLGVASGGIASFGFLGSSEFSAHLRHRNASSFFCISGGSNFSPRICLIILDMVVD